MPRRRGCPAAIAKHPLGSAASLSSCAKSTAADAVKNRCAITVAPSSPLLLRAPREDRPRTPKTIPARMSRTSSTVYNPRRAVKVKRLPLPPYINAWLSSPPSTPSLQPLPSPDQTATGKFCSNGPVRHLAYAINAQCIPIALSQRMNSIVSSA
jgi:hypothetical protein